MGGFEDLLLFFIRAFTLFMVLVNTVHLCVCLRMCRSLGTRETEVECNIERCNFVYYNDDDNINSSTLVFPLDHRDSPTNLVLRVTCGGCDHEQIRKPKKRGN